MQLDTATLFVVSALVAVLCGVFVILNTALTRNDAAGRFWSLAFLAGITVAIGYGANMGSPDAWWGTAVGNVAAAVAVGALWTGSRLHNGRGASFWVVGAVAGLVGLASIVFLPADGEWAGSVVLWCGTALLGGLGGSEAMRGRLRRNLNGRILGLSLWAVAVFSALRAAAYQLEGPTGELFSQYFGPANSTLLYLSLTLATAIAISILRAEQLGNNAVGDFTDGIHSAAGVMSAPAFQQAAEDHVERAARSQLGLAIIGADIDNLPEINTAFGRAAGDEAIARFADTLRQSAPVMALIGHRAAGRFLVLASVASATEAHSITERLQTALVDAPLSEASLIRLTASFGIADTYDHGYDLAALDGAVAAAIDAVKLAGGNDISVVTASA